VRLIALQGPKTIWLAAGQGPSLAAPTVLYRTVDGGRHWQPEARGTPGHPLFGSGRFPVAWDFPTATKGYAVVNAGVGACQAFYLVYATADGGARWTARSRVVGSDGPVAVEQPTARSPLWLANGSCAAATVIVWTSRSGGLRWTAPTFVPGPASARGGGPTALTWVPTPKGIALLAAFVRYSAKGTPLASYLTATAWPGPARTVHALPFRQPVSALAFASPAAGWAATASGLYQTANGGASWATVKPPVPFRQLDTPPVIAVIRASSGLEGWLGAGSHLWETRDGGQHWTAVPVP
jgi:photosystem II stability/assembly factor-like uncharacterized protein